jgi:hypothetical protein
MVRMEFVVKHLELIHLHKVISIIKQSFPSIIDQGQTCCNWYFFLERVEALQKQIEALQRRVTAGMLLNVILFRCSFEMLKLWFKVLFLGRASLCMFLNRWRFLFNYICYVLYNILLLVELFRKLAPSPCFPFSFICFHSYHPCCCFCSGEALVPCLLERGLHTWNPAICPTQLCAMFGASRNYLCNYDDHAFDRMSRAARRGKRCQLGWRASDLPQGGETR